jgi:hypothetical protein
MNHGLFPLAFGALLSLSGCATRQTAGPVHPSHRFAVCVTQAPIYQNGPAQSTGPDLFLHRSDRVTLVESKSGYSRVVTDAGFDGYIATRQLRPAPPEPIVVLPPAAPLQASTNHAAAPEPDLGLDFQDVITPAKPAPRHPAVR